MIKIIGDIFIIIGLIAVIIKPIIDEIRNEERIYQIIDLIFLGIFILIVIGIIYEMI